MCSINNVAGDVLQIFERILHFFQNVGIFHSFTFSHSEILFCPDAEKCLQNFISILAELKDIFEKLYTARNTQVYPESNLSAVNNHLITADLISTQHQIIVADNQLISESSSLIQSNTLITSHNHIITNNEFVTDVKQVVAANNELITSGNLIDCSGMIIDSGSQLIGHNFQEDKDGCRISSEIVSIDKDEEINSNVEQAWSETNDVLDKASSKTYECSICDKQLCSKTSLKSHMTTHTGHKPFCCEHCGKLFTTSPNLAAHLTRQHNLNTESALSCPECGKLFVRKSALDIHLARHTGLKPFKCHICERTFTQKVTRDTHILTHTKSYQYCCSQCPKRFPNQSKLNFHTKSHAEPQYSCSLCRKKFTTKQYLNVHYKTHNLPETEAPHCRLDTVSDSPTATAQAYENSALKCNQCGESFHSQGALKKHGQCKYSNLSLRYQFPLSEPKRSCTCTICGQSFPNRNTLLQHQRQDHDVVVNQLKNFACHLCSKRFVAKQKLNIHVKSHSEEPGFTCEVCKRKFYRSDTLRRHFLLHSVVPKYPCITCGSLFRTQTDLDRHSALHNAQFQCIHCVKSFKSKMALKYHVQKHHEGKYRFACSVCGKQFLRKCHYDAHLRSHSNNRPFKCDTCGRSFKDTKHLREHLKRVHPSPTDETMQLLESITSEDALTNQHTFHPMVDSSHCLTDTNFVFNPEDQFPNASIH